MAKFSTKSSAEHTGWTCRSSIAVVSHLVGDRSLASFHCECCPRLSSGALLTRYSVGDVLDLLLARMVIETAKQVDGGLPGHVVSQMYMNAMIDFAIGFVPFLGDIADAVFKCNTRNAVLLEKELRKRGKARLKGQAVEADPSLPDDWDREEQELNRHHGGPPPTYDGAAGAAPAAGSTGPALPPGAQANSGRSWFGGSGRQRQNDVEMAQNAPPQPQRAQSKRLQRERRG